MDASLHGAAAGIPPLWCWVSTRGREPVWGQCQVGSLISEVALERVSEAPVRTSKVPSEWLETIRRVQRQKGA